MACNESNYQPLPTIQTTSGGYDYEVHGETPRDCQCVICHHLLREAIDLPCGHVFCKKCLEDWENEIKGRNNDLVCSVCQTPYDTDSHHPNIPIDRMIRTSLDIYCKQRNKGCNWVGKISNYEDSKHLEKLCDYTQAQCKYRQVGCNKEFVRKDTSEHERSYREQHDAMLLRAFLDSKQDIANKFKETEQARTKINKDLTQAQEDLHKSENNADKLDVKIQGLESKIGTHQGSIAKLETTIAMDNTSSDVRHREITRKNTELTKDVKALQNEIKVLKSEINLATVNDVSKRDELRKDLEMKIKSGSVGRCSWWFLVFMAAFPFIVVIGIWVYEMYLK